MTIALTVIGAILGMIDGEFRGFLIGGSLGFALGSIFNIRQRLAEIRSDVDLLIASRNSAESPSQAIQTRPVTEPEAEAARHEPVIAPEQQPAAVTMDFRQPVAETIPASQTTISTPAKEQASYTYTEAEPIPDPWIITWIKNYFSGENLIARIGVIILFFGVAFLLKYAAEHTHVPIEMRLAGIAAGAAAMLVFGWRLRNRHADYALVLQGGAIGVLYLTVFAAMRLYHIMPPSLTLAIMVLMVLFSAMLAILQNSMALAILGICGGFLAPILTSTGQGSHVVLFSFYALLNIGIFGMAWFKAWRPLNVLGFLFTFVIGTMWGVTKYQPDDFASTEPFLILFFLLYVAIAMLYALRQQIELKNYVDGTLVFGTPIIAFGLQAGMTQHPDIKAIFEYGLSASAIILSTFYLVLARVLYQRKQESLRMLVESFIALGIVFFTLAIPLALDSRWTSASWALEGAAVLWMGVRQQRWLPRLFGAFLQFAAGVSLISSYWLYGSSMPILNSIFVGQMLIAIAGLFCAWYLYANRESLKWFELPLEWLLFGWGLLWWYSAGVREIEHFVPHELKLTTALSFFALSGIFFSLISTRANWKQARIPALGLLTVMWFFAIAQWFADRHPFNDTGYIGWLLSFVSFYLILKRHESAPSRLAWPYFHMATFWLLAFIASREAAWQIHAAVQGMGTWPLIAWAVMPGMLLGVIVMLGERLRWPLAAHYPTYLGNTAAPLAAFLWLWTIYANFSSDGNPYPISYLPLLNPLDLANIFVFMILGFWLLKLRSTDHPAVENLPRYMTATFLFAAVFIWLNAVLLRTLHYWVDIPLNLHSMTHSILVQASLSIFWSLLALGLMRYASQSQIRFVWMTGGGLMAAVVLKLFTIDISSAGSLERIVSFIGVALLMLLIAYIAPLPAKHAEGDTHE